jgi:hypothetical protein
MQVQWKKVVIKTTIWLTTEVLLNLLGVDQVVDISEFVVERKNLAARQWVQATTIVPGNSGCCVLQQR